MADTFEELAVATDTSRLVEEILRLMDERPEVLEAVRARVLTRELLEMPERLSRLEATVAELVETTREHTARLDRIDRSVNRIDGKFGALLGRDLELEAKQQAGEIARGIGEYTFIEKLTSEDLYHIHRGANATGVPVERLKSFRLADIVMRVEDADGESSYIAVEVSYTADERDTVRATRNAKYLTRFTGLSATPVIASVHIDERIKSMVVSGEIAWYDMEEPH